MSELDELRAKRLRQLQMAQQQAAGQQMQQNLQEQELESQINNILKQILTVEAQSRLANIRLARPEFARQVEILLIQLYQSGRLKSLDDKQLLALLTKISGEKRETKIQLK